MKPDWKGAPEWAQWVAMDKDGDWYWFEIKPFTGRCVWVPGGGRAELCEPAAAWEATLEERPQ